jgi:hypothetical protein
MQAKARICFAAISARLKVVPCYKARTKSDCFAARLLPRLFQALTVAKESPNNIHPGLKPASNQSPDRHE